jgi:hypothetical protein
LFYERNWKMTKLLQIYWHSSKEKQWKLSVLQPSSYLHVFSPRSGYTVNRPVDLYHAGVTLWNIYLIRKRSLITMKFVISQLVKLWSFIKIIHKLEKICIFETKNICKEMYVTWKVMPGHIHFFVKFHVFENSYYTIWHSGGIKG